MKKGITFSQMVLDSKRLGFVFSKISLRKIEIYFSSPYRYTLFFTLRDGLWRRDL
jgi:hypothetical protein